MSLRQVIKKISADLENEGDGAVVRKSITKIHHELLDPFVSLVEFSVSPLGGFRDHPHRGFESVTYMLQGGIIYQDFNGHKITIHEGDVQIPRAEEDGVEVKVIAGESMGVQSLSYTKVPIMFLDFTLQPRAQTHQTVPESWTAFAYVIDGEEGVFSTSDSSTVQAHSVVVFGKGDGVSVLNTSSSKLLRFLLIAGEPIGEPVVQHGPFVMNSQAEIDLTIGDYRNAKNGFEGAKSWRSE
ncbi:hypothetical protein HID58_026604 [Brassica napus]|uniref:Pirin-like protein n=1 Tax=Brassica napus TaxID=3708 RepID=A0ABQ8CPF3_BRANA|nr:hypothetical protein HID58_026604 [Brassica napus]